MTDHTQFPRHLPTTHTEIAEHLTLGPSAPDMPEISARAAAITDISTHLIWLLGQEWPDGVSGADLIDWLDEMFTIHDLYPSKGGE